MKRYGCDMFSASSPRKRGPRFQPFFKRMFTAWVPAFAGTTVFCCNLSATPAATVLIERAEQFKTLGLTTLAREQYLYAKKEYPKEKGISEALAELSRNELAQHLNNANYARKVGVLTLASLEYQRALKIDPNNEKIKGLAQEVAGALSLKKSLSGRVSKEYLQGLEYYQSGRFDKALDSFVKTLNMAPDHTGALHYVQKIGEKMGKVKNP